jgi:hypothetical protein
MLVQDKADGTIVNVGQPNSTPENGGDCLKDPNASTSKPLTGCNMSSVERSTEQC